MNGHLGCPGEVISAGLGASEGGDEGLESGPEVDVVEGPVEPAGRDAKVGVVGGDVVQPVMSLRQDQVAPLQKLHPLGQPKVRVGPLVDLICADNQDSQHEQKEREPVLFRRLCCQSWVDAS